MNTIDEFERDLEEHLSSLRTMWRGLPSGLHLSPFPFLFRASLFALNFPSLHFYAFNLFYF